MTDPDGDVFGGLDVTGLSWDDLMKLPPAFRMVVETMKDHRVSMFANYT